MMASSPTWFVVTICNRFQMHALSFNLVKWKTTWAISLTETRTWSLTFLSKDYTIDGHSVRIVLHNTFCILVRRENTMACMRGVSMHCRARYRFIFTIGLRLRDIPDDLSMWRVGLPQLNNSFLYMSREHVRSTRVRWSATRKKEIPFLNFFFFIPVN